MVIVLKRYPQTPNIPLSMWKILPKLSTLSIQILSGNRSVHAIINCLESVPGDDVEWYFHHNHMLFGWSDQVGRGIKNRRVTNTLKFPNALQV